jgi:flavorubredoxin
MPGAVIDEVGPDLFRVSVFVSQVNLQFNHFLVRNEEPLLFHTGPKEMFPLVRHAVASLIELSQLRWIDFGHLESDECGSLPEWLAAASGAPSLCSQISARVNRDFTSSVKAARGMADGELVETGKYRFRFCRTAQLPHGWDAGCSSRRRRGRSCARICCTRTATAQRWSKTT